MNGPPTPPKPPKPEKAPKTGVKAVLLVVGLVLILVGGYLIAVGAAPLLEMFELMNGSAPEEGFLEQMMADMKAGGVKAGIGAGLLLPGIILAKIGLSKPKPKSVEQLVQEEVERRMAALAPVAPAAPASRGPAAAATDPLDAPLPPQAPAAARRAMPMEPLLPTPPRAAQRSEPVLASARPVFTVAPAGGAAAAGSMPSARPRRCPDCSGMLVAGGRFCGVCGRKMT